MLESFQQLSKTHSGPGFKTGGKATDIHGYFGLLPPKKNRYSVQDDLAISNQASGSAPPFCPLRTINIPFHSLLTLTPMPTATIPPSSSAGPRARARRQGAGHTSTTEDSIITNEKTCDKSPPCIPAHCTLRVSSAVRVEQLLAPVD